MARTTFGIGGRDLIARQHLLIICVIRLVLVQGLDGPVAPSPDVPLRVAHLVLDAPAIPIGVAPDVQPVPTPALAVAWLASSRSTILSYAAGFCRSRTAEPPPV